ncbi:MAG: hypothetical protein ABIG63_21635 [Chloroflexota bacterium]
MTLIKTSIPLALAAVLFIVLSAAIMGREHADTKHLEAPIIRARIQQGLCMAKEVRFAPTSGRLLILCQLENDPALWGGWIVFLTQNNGTEMIPPHEATVFVAPWEYWDGVIKRNGYVLGAYFPAVLDHATDALGIPLP